MSQYGYNNSLKNINDYQLNIITPSKYQFTEYKLQQYNTVFNNIWWNQAHSQLQVLHKGIQIQNIGLQIERFYGNKTTFHIQQKIWDFLEQFSYSRYKDTLSNIKTYVLTQLIVDTLFSNYLYSQGNNNRYSPSFLRRWSYYESYLLLLYNYFGFNIQ